MLQLCLRHFQIQKQLKLRIDQIEQEHEITDILLFHYDKKFFIQIKNFIVIYSNFHKELI